MPRWNHLFPLMAELSQPCISADNHGVSEEVIQVGDVVSLRAGGPPMTVQARSLNLAYCAWKVEGRVHQGTFEVNGLRLLRPGLGGVAGSEADPPATSS